jgi:hypothetical protein
VEGARVGVAARVAPAGATRGQAEPFFFPRGIDPSATLPSPYLPVKDPSLSFLIFYFRHTSRLLQLPCHDEVMRFALLWTSPVPLPVQRMEEGRKLLRLSAVSDFLLSSLGLSTYYVQQQARQLESSWIDITHSRHQGTNPRCVFSSTAGVAVSTRLQGTEETFHVSCPARFRVQTSERSAAGLPQDGFKGWLMRQQLRRSLDYNIFHSE